MQLVLVKTSRQDLSEALPETEETEQEHDKVEDKQSRHLPPQNYDAVPLQAYTSDDHEEITELLNSIRK